MTYTAHEPRPLYAAVTTRLETTGKLVGQEVSPSGERPRMVLHPWPALDSEGGLTDPHEIARPRFLITSEGDSLEEAEWMRHKARAVLLGWTPTLSGLVVGPIHLDEDAGGTRDDDVTPPIFLAWDRYWLFTTRA